MIHSISRVCQSSSHDAEIAGTNPPLSKFSLRVCEKCLTETRRNLVSIPSIYRDLEHRLGAPIRHFSFIRTASGRRGDGTFLNEETVDTRAAIRGVLLSWSKLVTDERDISGPAVGSLEVTSLTKFLILHLDWLAAHRAAVEFVDEIRDVVVAAVSYGDQGKVCDIGSYSCIVPGCGAQLSARVRGMANAPAAEIRCVNGHAWSTEEWLLVRRRIKDGTAPAPLADRTVSTRAAALALGVPEATIRQWARRGKLTRHGTECRAEYDLEELTRLAERRPR